MPDSIYRLAVAVVFAALIACGCSSNERRDVRLPAALHQTDTQTTDPDEALRDREILLRDVRLHLSAITGHTTGSTHPVLVQLEEESRKIRDGVRALHTEMDMHGLQFEQAMDDLIRALDHHYTVLAQIRDELIRLEVERSPTDTERRDREPAPEPENDGTEDHGPPTDGDGETGADRGTGTPPDDGDAEQPDTGGNGSE